MNKQSFDGIDMLLITALAYLLVGFWLMRNSCSRGLRADISFVLFWGVHLIHETFFRGDD